MITSLLTRGLITPHIQAFIWHERYEKYRDSCGVSAVLHVRRGAGRHEGHEGMRLIYSEEEMADTEEGMVKGRQSRQADEEGAGRGKGPGRRRAEYGETARE